MQQNIMHKPIVPANLNDTLNSNVYNKFNSYQGISGVSSNLNSSTVNSSISKLSEELGYNNRDQMNYYEKLLKEKTKSNKNNDSKKQESIASTADMALKQKISFLQKYSDPMKSNPKMHLGNYQLICTVGKGSFGRVILSMLMSQKKYYAVKVLDKRKLVRDKQVKHVLNERNILNSCDHPNIVKLHFCFKDNSFLYLVLDIACNGDLFALIRNFNHFDENLSTFFAANIFLALEYLHTLNVIYRDLKPENILIQPNGYLKLTDFGFAKLLVNGRTNTMCGTPDYISPEVIRRIPYGKSVDWWAFGVFIYELNKGKTPFYSKSHTSTYEKIKKNEYKIPSSFGSSLTDLISKLLVNDIPQRLGCGINGSVDIKNHRWFNRVDWMKMYTQKYQAPFVPKFKDPVQLAYERSGYPEDKIEISNKEEYGQEFEDF